MSSRILQILKSDHLEVDRLFRDVFAAVDDADGARTFETLDVFWARLAVHIRAEHLQLFSALAELSTDGNDIENLLVRLKEDHNFFMTQLGGAVKIARGFTNGGDGSVVELRQILEKVGDRLAIHDHIEENELYPLADESNLSAELVDRIAAGIRRELDDLPSRFAHSEQNDAPS